jgi:hypothetical protein
MAAHDSAPGNLVGKTQRLQEVNWPSWGLNSSSILPVFTYSKFCQWIEDQDLQVTTVIPLLFCPNSLRKRHYHCRWDSGPWDVTSSCLSYHFHLASPWITRVRLQIYVAVRKTGGPLNRSIQAQMQDAATGAKDCRVPLHPPKLTHRSHQQS